LNFKEIKPYIGDLSQIFPVREFRLCGGKSDGVRAIDVKNGAGIDMTILIDRCMDISHLRYKGINIGYISPCGVVAPEYFGDKGLEFIRSFTVGFLTTCGLSTIGTPCVDGDEELGLHGRISNTPAENFSVNVEEENGVPVLRVKGTMREAILYGAYLTLTREIVCEYGKNVIKIKDTVENKSFKKLPHMQLYHFNYGYPLLTEETKLLLPSSSLVPRNDHAATGLDRWNIVETPTDGYEEMCFYHDLKADSKGETLAGVYNPTLNTGVIVRFDKNMFDNFTEWKMMGKGEYVLALEPCNARVDGRTEERKHGRLKYLEPGEKKVYNLTVEFLDGADDLSKASEEIKKLLKGGV
jgi:hypothetical protein